MPRLNSAMLTPAISRLQVSTSQELEARRVNVDPCILSQCCEGFIERDQ